MGRISREWLELYEQRMTKSKRTQKTESWIWGCHIVEHTLQSLIELWEQRNEEMHGESTKVSGIWRECLIVEVKDLQKLKHWAKPSDSFLFLRDPEQFYKVATVRTLATYIVTAKKAILKSVKGWEKQFTEGTVSVLGWLRRNGMNMDKIAKIEKEQQRIWEDGRKKKRRRCKHIKVQRNTLNNYFNSVWTL